MTRGQEGGAKRRDATTSITKTTRGRHSERMTRDINSGDDDCNDNSNGNSDGDGDSSNSDSGDNNSNSNNGSGDSNSGGKNSNQLKPAAEKAATAVNAALAPILLAS